MPLIVVVAVLLLTLLLLVHLVFVVDPAVEFAVDVFLFIKLLECCCVDAGVVVAAVGHGTAGALAMPC